MTKSRGLRRRSPQGLIRKINATTAVVSLTKQKVAVIDVADIPLVASDVWTAHSAGYAYRNDKITRNIVLMHRTICGAQSGTTVDHLNGDKLDNRRANLRITDRSINGHNVRVLRTNNTSGFRGVRWREDRKKWEASIKIFYVSHSLGLHDSFAAAVTARKDAEARFKVTPH